MRKIAPAITDLYFRSESPSETADPPLAKTHKRWYIDTARELSKVNRRMYSQSRMYAYQGLTFIWKADSAAIATIEVAVRTAGNTWIVHNAHVKGHALWNQMQELVLEDNPSLKAKWHDYKVTLATSQTGWTGSGNSLSCRDSAGNLYEEGEWNMSTYVMPQHDTILDPVTGESTPLPAEEFDGCLIGGDNVSRRSLVKAYEESRATVSPDQPNTPSGMPDSFFSLLTDSGSQEPELATVIQNENENPPYSLDNYPQGDTNAPVTTTVAYGAISAAEVDGRIPGFVAPCGLLEVSVKAFDSTGQELLAADTPTIDLLLHVAPGTYKGVAAIPMGQ